MGSGVLVFMHNVWKGFVLGLAGGAAGVLAMDCSQKALAKAFPEGQGSGPEQDISLLGRLYREGEGSTVALGRIFYEKLTGKEPQSEEAKTILSYLVHWGYGMKAGGLYGALRARPDGPDILGGAAYGITLWAIGDEIAVPLLGLSSAPQAYGMATHGRALAAHVVYGISTALAVQALKGVFGED